MITHKMQLLFREDETGQGVPLTMAVLVDALMKADIDVEFGEDVIILSKRKAL